MTSHILKPFVPLLAVAYGFMLIYVTALPLSDGTHCFGREALTWLITTAAIALTFVLVARGETKVFPEARRFSLKMPTAAVVAALLLMAPLWCVAEGYAVYGLTSLVHSVRLEPVAYTADEMREDLLASVHAVLLAPLLEELCFRQAAIAPFRRRGAQVAVCLLMALMFGCLHGRNFLGASLDAMLYGMVFIWTRNIWYAVLLHAGHNLTATLLALYCTLGLGEMQMAKMPVVILPDLKVVVVATALALLAFAMLKRKLPKRDSAPCTNQTGRT